MQDRGREEIDFERPPFAAAGKMERADYLHPSLSVGGMSVGAYRNDRPRLDESEANAPTAVYMLPVLLRATPACHLWADGIHQTNPALPVGTINGFDLRQQWRADLSFPFHSVHFYIPLTAFDELTSELRRPRIEQLACRPGLVTFDRTAYHLAQALLPALEQRTRMPGLLSDQILSALRLHIACQHGSLILPGTDASSLSREQVRLLRELMLDEPSELRLADLARICRMPVHQFSQAVRKSFGSSPYKWRLDVRLERARKLLEATELPIAHVAQTCGFYDQPHLTHCFKRQLGITPASYRRSRRNG